MVMDRITIVFFERGDDHQPQPIKRYRDCVEAAAAIATHCSREQLERIAAVIDEQLRREVDHLELGVPASA